VESYSSPELFELTGTIYAGKKRKASEKIVKFTEFAGVFARFHEPQV
jgi:hypothetical protein